MGRSTTNLAIPDERRGLPTIAKKVGTVAAYASFLCSASLWIGMLLWHLFHFSWMNRFTGLDFLKIMGAGVVLSVISGVCRVKLAILAAPVAIVMIFLVMYVMGS